MSIALVGLSFRTAPVALREQVTAAFAALGASNLAAETLVLSTCNRFEVYVADDATPEVAVTRAQAAIAALGPADEIVPHLYSRAGAAEVAEHLFTVAAGLDSMVIGEAQILGQVGDALQAALAQGTAGRQLAALARCAITAGRRVRNETRLGHGSGSVSHAAVALAKQVLGDLSDRRVLLIGAGKMAEIAAHTLAGDRVGAVRVLNRDPARAAAVAAAIGGDWCGWDALPDALAWADVAITSTGAPHTLIHAQTVAASLARRADRPLLIIDLAVPRDVDRAVGDLADVRLADIDTLQTTVTDGIQRRQEAIPAARAIIQDEVAHYVARTAVLGVAPTIVDLRERAERIREAEVQKTLRRLGTLDPDAQRAVEALSVALVNKLLHAPTVELKRHAADTRFTQAARTLFGLQPDMQE
jgi:glutamyl-tRNA reductase